MIIPFLVVIIVLGFVVDVRIGMMLATIIFAIFFALLIKSKMNITMKENFSSLEPCSKTPEFKYTNKKYGSSTNPPPYSTNNSCNDNISYDCMKFNSDPFKTKEVVVNKNMISINNNLQGGPNPKTMIPPMVTMPMYDLKWRPNKLVVPNKINRRTNENLYLSGYLSPYDEIPEENEEKTLSYGYQPKNNNTVSGSGSVDNVMNNNNTIKENYSSPPSEEFNIKNSYVYETQQYPEQVNTVDGYDSSQWTTSKFPANLPQGKCNQSSKLVDNHEQLFTQTVQPNVFYKNNVIEPINANIGISWDQQFLPRTFDYHGDSLDIVDHDPTFAPPPVPVNGEPVEADIYNVYDPRMTGYGTNYRNYVDDTTGQPRFVYDDVNSIRMPNYITRSKIDTHDFADKYGSVKTGQSLNDVRSKAQDAFLNDSLDHRTDLMSRLMRKRNSEMWQLRQSPMYKSSGRSLGGGK